MISLTQEALNIKKNDKMDFIKIEKFAYQKKGFKKVKIKPQSRRKYSQNMYLTKDYMKNTYSLRRKGKIIQLKHGKKG